MNGDRDIDRGSSRQSSPPKKKMGGISRFVKKTIRRKFSSSSASFPSTSCEDDNDNDNEVVDTKIPLDVGAEAVPMAEDRLSEMLKRTRFVRQRNKMLGVPSFQQDAFEVGELIARGGFAHVHKLESWHNDSELNEDDNWGKEYVLKTLRADVAGRNPERLATMASDLMMEAHYLSALEHPHILALRGISTRKLSSLKRGRVDGLFLILDYLPVTLYHRLVTWQQAEEEEEELLASEGEPQSSSLPERFRAAIDLASALKYVHSKSIVYRDIKPSNVGFDVQGRLQLFDFGLAIEIPKSSDPNRTYQLAGRKGTARYMAPENIKEKPYNAKADVFGMAILTWQLLALSKPFCNQTTSDAVLQKICNGDRPTLKHLPFEKTSPTYAPLAQLLTNAWSKSIADRPTMKRMHAQLVQIAQQALGLGGEAKSFACAQKQEQAAETSEGDRPVAEGDDHDDEGSEGSEDDHSNPDILVEPGYHDVKEC